MLKPTLARGQLRMVGATRLDEYRTHIEKDPALERRFQQVFVGEPTVQDTIGILRGFKERYEVHHGVRMQDAGLVAAAVLSDRYVIGRFPPDKPIDVVDEAASRLRIEIDSLRTEIDVVERRIRQLEIERVALSKETDDASRERLDALERELADLREQSPAMKAQWQAEKGSHRRHPRAQGAARAAALAGGARERPQPRRGDPLRTDQGAGEAGGAGDRRLAALQAEQQMLKEDIAEVVSRSTGILVSRLMQGEVAKLVRMEDVLHARVVGQHAAVPAVANAIRRSRSGLADRNARSAASCSSARPASARPSSPAAWRSSCSTTSARWCAST